MSNLSVRSHVLTTAVLGVILILSNVFDLMNVLATLIISEADKQAILTFTGRE